jgi:hypothetical protein
MIYRGFLTAAARPSGWPKLLRLAESLGRLPSSFRATPPPVEEGWRPEVLQDPGLQQRFETDGFIRLPAIDPTTLSLLLAEVPGLLPSEAGPPPAAASPHHCSFIHADEGRRRKVQAVFAPAFAPYVEKHLKGYRVLHAALHVKPPGGGCLPLHMNWSSVADLNRSTVTLWCPLVDVGLHNGTLEVVPRSHRISRRINDNGSPYFGGYLDLLAGMAVPQPARAGEIILLEDTVLHHSQSNDSPRARIAAQIVCVPKAATPVFYYEATPDLYEVIEADSDFFYRYDFSAVKVRQDGWRSLGFVRRSTDSPDAAECLRRMRNPSHIRRRGFRLEAAAASQGN